MTEEKKPFNKSEYDQEYQRKNYKRVPFNMRFDAYDEMKQCAESRGMGVTEFMRLAIKHEMEKS